MCIYIYFCFICICILYSVYMNVGVGSPVTVRNDEVASTIGTWERVRRGGCGDWCVDVWVWRGRGGIGV